MRKNFTLIELLVVVAIIGILMSILLPSLQKSRTAASLAVCVSNIRQVNTANQMFLTDSGGFYPNKNDVINLAEPNIGYQYAGVGGSESNVVRPLNKYLGATSDMTDLKVAQCPSEDFVNPVSYITKWNSSYMGNARGDDNNDLDGNTANGDKVSQAAIIRPTRMVAITGSGGYHWARWGDTQWSKDNHGKQKFPLSFVDGHARIVKIFQSKGFTTTEDITFQNN
ncbi:MAG: type II secretion system GspH family protein [Lentisphaeraceae bacterium]|nr:type II secretion system GspH family protein [Lentisphaeraceae bacterium]